MITTDTHTFKEIISSYKDELFHFIMGRVANPEDAEDLLQEVLFQLTRTLQKETLDNPRAWLYRVARNKIIDWYRKKPIDWIEDLVEDEEFLYGDLAPIEEEDGPDLQFLREQFWELLYEALELLPEAQREVFIMNELEGVTLREIAERKGEKLKTIISRKGYAMRQLRGRLEDMFEELVGVD